METNDTSIDKRAIYVKGLMEQIISGSEDGEEKWNEICECANGGDPTAQKFVREIENMGVEMASSLEDVKV